MMPLYEYVCTAGHRTELLRKYDDRDAPAECQCGENAERSLSSSHVPPDGVYSYAPNLGDEGAFERRLIAMKNGEKLIKK